jgi:hypothetical protein
MPAHARNSARTRPQQIEEDGGVTSDEEVLEQMLLLTRSYRSALALLERLSVCIGLDWMRTPDPAPIQSNKIAGLVVVDS